MTESQQSAPITRIAEAPSWGGVELFDIIPQPAWVADPEGWVHYCNRRWYDYTGTTPEQMAGWGWQCVHDPKVLPALLARWRDALASGEPFEMSHPLRRKDGVYRWFTTRAVPMRDADGKILRWVGISTDIEGQIRLEQVQRRSTEEELHASEERFHTLVDSITDYAIFLLDAIGRVVTWNSGAKKIKGYDAGEIVGKHFSVFYTPEDRAAGKPERVLDAVRREGRFEDENWRVRKDGSRFWADVVITALRNKNSEIVGFAKVTRDLTERRAAEERLHASEARFHTLVDSITDYAIFMLDAGGHVSTWNAGAKKTKGYAADEIIGKHFSVFYTPEDRAAGKPERILETVRREGHVEDESWRVRKDGSRFWADVVITALRDQKGQIVGFAKVTRDLSERRAAEENARKLVREQGARAASEQERQRLLTLLKQVPATINFFRGADLVFEFAHPKMVEACGGRDPTGRPLLEACPELRGQPYPERLRRVYETGEPFVEHEEPRGASEGRAPASYWDAVYVPVRSASGAIEGVMTFETEITSSVRAREAVEAASRAKDEFLATMSHELRTPLNAISGWASILRKKPRDAERLERGLETIDRNAHALTRIVGDLLDMSRIITGKLALRMVKTDILPLIVAAADVVRPAADGKGVRLVVDIDPEIGATVADPERIQQIVWNLLANAVRFTPRGGRVTVTGDRSGSGLVIRVEDTGAGISAQHLPHIFDRFMQVDSSITRAHGGLGLGLAIVRHLVEGHGGTVEAASEGLGRGATFTVRLPIRAVSVERPEPEGPAEAAALSGGELEALAGPSSSLQNLRVLIVDDDADSLELVRTVLETAGASVTAAASAREAFDALDARGPFGIIISDIGMPGIDGYAFIRGVRARGAGGDVPAIALTAYARAEDAERARSAGYQDHLAKPVDETRLLETVKNLSAQALN